MEDFQYDPAGDLAQGWKERLNRFPREPDITVYALRSTVALLMRFWLKLFHRFQIKGKHHLPGRGSFVLVANHASHLDAPCLLASIPLKKLHRAFPAAAADYFFNSLPRSAFSAIFINALPFDRVKKGTESLAVCKELLLNPGNILIIFPEGTRSPDGRVQRFKSGIARLVAGTEIPVLPCRLKGCHEAYPKGARFPLPKKISLAIGKPMTFENHSPGKPANDLICETLHRMVAGEDGQT